ncbi:MAG: hypothetical protein CVT64_10055 [Actinobacteria bacterium HGW-Actinobacteria-4]|nr:MAG: hypothetical protein CVT64_10055 [Actinobacteria bacterium HGW-Actinobacteria-4]
MSTNGKKPVDLTELAKEFSIHAPKEEAEMSERDKTTDKNAKGVKGPARMSRSMMANTLTGQGGGA